MPPMIRLILLVLSVACFAFATWRPEPPDKQRVVTLGLALGFASFLTW
jgi:hypothetical protein